MTTLLRGLAGTTLAVLVLALTGCSGGGADGEASAGAALDEDAAAELMAPQGAPEAAGGDLASRGGVNRTVVKLRSVIKTGEVAVTHRNLDAAREELDEVLLALDGIVDRESTQHDRKGRIERSTLVVRVPVDRFDVAMSAVEGLGRVKHSDTASKDVTTEVIDVDERVETLETSLDRLQDYQRDAADIDDLIRFEQQITQREAELQSLKSQQAYLADQTSMSTITLYLSTPETFVAPPGALDDAGFLAGLMSGWGALKDTVVVALTVVGAVLPFAVVLLVVGGPVWLLVRRTARARVVAAPTSPEDGA